MGTKQCSSRHDYTAYAENTGLRHDVEFRDLECTRELGHGGPCSCPVAERGFDTVLYWTAEDMEDGRLGDHQERLAANGYYYDSHVKLRDVVISALEDAGCDVSDWGRQSALASCEYAYQLAA